MIMPIRTPESIRRVNRKFDRRNERRRWHREEVARVLDEMRRGAALHRCNRGHRVLWSLSNGLFVSAEAATEALKDPKIVGVGDALFGPELSQTFRYVD
jgi:hypothetical protein